MPEEAYVFVRPDVVVVHIVVAAVQEEPYRMVRDHPVAERILVRVVAAEEAHSIAAAVAAEDRPHLRSCRLAAEVYHIAMAVAVSLMLPAETRNRVLP